MNDHKWDTAADQGLLDRESAPRPRHALLVRRTRLLSIAQRHAVGIEVQPGQFKKGKEGVEALRQM